MQLPCVRLVSSEPRRAAAWLRLLAYGLQQLTVHRSILKRALALPFAAVLVCTCAPFVALSAQRARGPGDDATVLRRGELRVGIRTEWGFSDQRYARDGSPSTGKPEPLGADFTRPLDATVFEQLTAIQAALTSLLGSPAPALSAGALRTTMDLGVFTTPFTLDLGLTNRLMLAAVIPYVKNRNDITVYANSPPGSANVGVNPSLGSAQAQALNGLVVAQLTTAANTLNSELTRCAQSTDASCTAINANRAGAQALATQATTTATAIGALWGTTTVKGSLFVPLGNSPLDGAVGQSLGAIAAQLQTFLGAPPTGITWVDARPIAATMMAFNAFQAALADSSVGIVGVPLESVERSHLGDVAVGAKFLLLDTTRPVHGVTEGDEHPGIRVAASGLYRFATAQREFPDNFADFGTGDRQPDIEMAGYVDAVLSKRLWVSAIGRYALQQQDELTLRIPAANGDPFPALYRQQNVQRNLGDVMMLDVTPRYSPSDVLTIAASYRWWHKGADAYRGSFTVTDLTGASQTIDASILNQASDQSEQRVGAAVSYSTLSAWQRRRARWPVEVMVGRWQTIGGSNGVLKTTATTFGLRYYTRLFGAPLRPPPPPAPPSPFTR